MSRSSSPVVFGLMAIEKAKAIGAKTQRERDYIEAIGAYYDHFAERPQRARRPAVFVVLGTAPIFTVGRGSYIASLLELAGARNAAADVRAPYARYSAEALVARQPDALIVDPDVRFAEVAGTPPWSSLHAVQQHHVYVLPDAAILERPGPRYNDGLAWLIATLSNVRT